MSFEDLLHPYVGRYMDSPEWVKASAGRAYAWLPPRLRYGSAYDRFREEARPRQDAAAMQRLVRQKLDETLRWAIQTVPAYKAFGELLRAPRDPFRILERLPITGKLEIKHDLESYVSDAMPESARLEMFTGGSTRNPMRFFLTKHLSRTKEYAFMQAFRDRIGLEEGDMTLALRGRTVPTAGEGRIWMVEPIKRQLILSSDHLVRRYMPQYAEALAAHRPQWIEAFPSALFPLARWLAENPLPEFTKNVRGVMLFSENVYGYQLRKIRQVFGCPVLAHYGHSERVLMAASMPGDDRYFFFPQYGHFELVDNDGRTITEPGRVGHIVGTSFDSRVMPFVRYRTGDLGVLSAGGEHPELPGYPVCERIEGRLHEFVVCRDDRLVSITTLGVAHFPELSSVEAIQYEQRVAGQLVLKVVSHTPLTAKQREGIAHAVGAKTQGGCHVEVAQVESIPRTRSGKHVMLEQHLPLARYWGVA